MMSKKEGWDSCYQSNEIKAKPLVISRTACVYHFRSKTPKADRRSNKKPPISMQCKSSNGLLIY